MGNEGQKVTYSTIQRVVIFFNVHNNSYFSPGEIVWWPSAWMKKKYS